MTKMRIKFTLADFTDLRDFYFKIINKSAQSAKSARNKK